MFKKSFVKTFTKTPAMGRRTRFCVSEASVFNSHAWGRAPRRPRDFKFVFEMFELTDLFEQKWLYPSIRL